MPRPDLQLLQIRSYKAFQLAIHHCVHIAHFISRAVILDHRIGLEHIGSDLAAPFNLLELALDFTHLFLALLLWSLFQQLAMFLVSLYDELSLKLK